MRGTMLPLALPRRGLFRSLAQPSGTREQVGTREQAGSQKEAGRCLLALPPFPSKQHRSSRWLPPAQRFLALPSHFLPIARGREPRPIECVGCP